MILNKLCCSVFLFASLFVTGTVFAVDRPVTVKMTLSEKIIEVGDNLSLLLEIQKSPDSNAVVSPKFDIPGIEYFSQVGSSQSMQMTNINGKSSAITEIRKNLIAKKEGNFSLGPVIVSYQLDGKTMAEKIPALIVKVVKDSGAIKANKSGSMGSSGDFFREQPVEKEQNSFMEELSGFSNFKFWGQVLSIVILFSLVWYFLSKKLDKRQNGEIVVVEKEKTEKEPEEEKLKLSDWEFPATDDPKFLNGIRDVLAKFCVQKFDLNVSEITKRSILPKAQESFEEDVFKQFEEILSDYEKARFANYSIDKRVFSERIELFIQKYL